MTEQAELMRAWLQRMKPRRVAYAAVLSLAGGLLLAPGASVPAAQAESGKATETNGRCRVVQLATPRGALGSWVLDMTKDGRYFGAMVSADETYTPLYWKSAAAKPMVIKTGLVSAIAYDITESGTLLGEGEDADGAFHGWIKRPGRAVKVLGEDYIRRINERGQAAGAVWAPRRETLAAARWQRLPGRPHQVARPGEFSMGFGINERGDIAGVRNKGGWEENPNWRISRPTVWTSDGRLLTYRRAGLDALIRLIDERRRAAGVAWWGWDDVGHLEPAFWGRKGHIRALGLLRDGIEGQAFGMSDGAWVTGRQVRSSRRDGLVDHGFLWLRSYGKHHMRLLPSIEADRAGYQGRFARWQTWQTYAPHAVSTLRNEVGGESSVGRMMQTPDGPQPVSRATVWRNATSCGQMVRTGHYSDNDQPPMGQQQRSASCAHESPGRLGIRVQGMATLGTASRAC